MIPIWFILFYICVGIFSKEEDKWKSTIADEEQFLGNAQKIRGLSDFFGKKESRGLEKKKFNTSQKEDLERWEEKEWSRKEVSRTIDRNRSVALRFFRFEKTSGNRCLLASLVSETPVTEAWNQNHQLQKQAHNQQAFWTCSMEIQNSGREGRGERLKKDVL